MTEQNEQTGQFVPSPETREQRVNDAALKAAMLLDEAPTTVAEPVSTTTPAPVEAAKPEATVKRSSAHDKALATLELAGMKRSVAERLSEGEALEFAAHRHKVDADSKAMATRLNELETLSKSKGDAPSKTDAQAPAEIGRHPVSTGQGPSFVDAAKPVAKVLGLGDDEVPILASFADAVARAATDAVRAEFADRVSLLESVAGDTLSGAQYAVREELSKTFSQFNDEAQVAEHTKLVESLILTPFFKDSAPTYQGRLKKVSEAAALMLGWQPPAPPAPRQDQAKSNGQPIVASRTESTRPKSRMDDVDAAAMKAALLVSD